MFIWLHNYSLVFPVVNVIGVSANVTELVVAVLMYAANKDQIPMLVYKLTHQLVF